MELDPEAYVFAQPSAAAAGLRRPGGAFARLNRALSDLKGSLQIRCSELEGGTVISLALEEKLLKLKNTGAMEIAREAETNPAEIAGVPRGQVLPPISSSGKNWQKRLEKLRRPAENVDESCPKRYQEWFDAASRNCADIERME